MRIGITSSASALVLMAGLATGAAALVGAPEKSAAPATPSLAANAADTDSGTPERPVRVFQRQADGGFSADDLARMTPQEVWQNVGPIMACYSQASPPDEKTIRIVEEARRVFNDAQGERHNLNDRWGFASAVTQDTITWSFAPDGQFIPSGIGEGTAPNEIFARLDQLFGNNTALWIAQFEDSFDRWAELGGVNYVRETFGGNEWDDGAGWGSVGQAGQRGDVRISMKPIDGGSGVLAYNSFPDNGDMVLDRQENWASSSGSFRFFRNIIMHEHGHGLGMFHLCPIANATLMEPFLSTNFDGPQHDDIRAIQRGYGDIFEPSQNAGQATPLGTLSVGSPISVGAVPSPNVAFGSVVSISTNSDQDWFEINTNTDIAVSVTVTPVGRIYDDSDQNGGGPAGCASGNTIDSRRIQDLAVQIYDADGSTLLATADGNGLGQSETLTDVFVGNPGTFYVRVYETGTFSDSQLYTISFSAVDAECSTDADCDDGDPCNGVEICDRGLCMPGTIIDCNNNGIDDACDIDSGFSLDCNENGIPDECDVAAITYDASSGNLAGLDFRFPAVTTFTDAPIADGDVELTISAIGEFAATGNSVSFFINNQFFGPLLVNGSNCPATPESETITIPAADWNAQRDMNGEVVVTAFTAGSAAGSFCGADAFSEISVAYIGASNSADVNENGIPDECEEPATPCPFDLTGPALDGIADGTVDASDLTLYLDAYIAQFGTAGGGGPNGFNADLTGPALDGIADGTVDASDLTFYLDGYIADFGDCPQ